MQTTPINVTVAIPLLNEEGNVVELIRRTGAVLDGLGGDHQIIIVDDGSTDQTWQRLVAEAEQDQRLLLISLSRNFGHQAAISAALDHATGEVVVVMDGDLQDAPESIPIFLEHYLAGYDVVYAIRHKRKENIAKRSCYKLFYWLLSKLSDLEVPIDSGDFGLMSRRVVDLMKRAPERQRFLRGLRSWYGFRQKGILVERDARHQGKPKYTFAKLVALAFDGIFAFSTVPIRLAILAGMAAMTSSLLYSFYAIYGRLYFLPSEQAPAGFTALVVIITFLSGVNLMFAGIIGEYVGRIYEEVKQRPLYVVDKMIGKKS